MKLALCLHPDPRLAHQLAGEVLEAQRREPGCAARLLPFPGGCLALLGRPDEAPARWPVWEEPATGSFLAMAGLPLVTTGPRPGPPRTDDPLVREAMATTDPERVARALAALDGAFVAVWWDAPRGTLTLVTDFLGMQPLYRAERPAAPADATAALLFASEVKGLARVLPLVPDAGAWGAMLYFGHQIGPRTLLSGVTRVPAATRLALTPAADGRPGARPSERATGTWAWPASTGAPDTPALHDALGEALRADVAAYAAAQPEAALLLSGGFDSRLILCLAHEAGVRPRVLVQSHPDENADADARFAQAFARAVGAPARVVEARADFYGSDAYLRFLASNEVATPSLYLFIPNVAALVREERHGVWEGLLLDPALKFGYGEGGFASYLEKRTGGRRRAQAAAARRIFAPDWVERMEAEYEGLLAEERARYVDDAEGVWQFSVRNRSRFRTGVNPYQVYDTSTPPLTPGMSRAFWETVAHVDPRVRFGKRLYRAVFERLAPGGMRVPVASAHELLPGAGHRGLYLSQRARAAVQRVAQRPRVTRLLRRAGLPAPFTWAPSRFLDLAVREASLDDPRLAADWLRRRRGGEATTPTDAIAAEIVMYWQAWHHVLGGDVIAAWGGVPER